MNQLPDIQRAALVLPAGDRAKLALSLLLSLEEETELLDEIERDWIEEADRRFQEIQDGIDVGVPAEEVFAELGKRHS